MTDDKYATRFDSWEKVANANKMAQKLVHAMCEIKPDAKKHPKEFAQWDAEMNEVRRWCIEIHYRGIDLNMQALAAYRKAVNSVA